MQLKHEFYEPLSLVSGGSTTPPCYFFLLKIISDDFPYQSFIYDLFSLYIFAGQRNAKEARNETGTSGN